VNEDANGIPRIAGGVSARLRNLATALDRLDRLESGSGEWLPRFEDSELAGAATEMTLRALRTACDPTNFALLDTLAGADSLSLDQLISASGLLRLPLSERLNDLVQVGLAGRNIDTDHAQITLAGTSTVELIHQIAKEVREQYMQVA